MRQLQVIASICEKCDLHTSAIYRILDRNNVKRINNFSKWEGKEHSKETKEKMSKFRKEYWEKKKL